MSQEFFETSPTPTFISVKTKVSTRKMESIRKKCGYEFDIDIRVDESRGGLSLGWRGDFSVILKSFSKSHIDVEIEKENTGFCYRFTGFYGSPVEQ